MTKAFSNTTIGESVLQFAALLIKSLLLLSALFVLSLQGSKAQAQEWDRGGTLKADLVSFEQVPSVLASSHGKFEAQINDNDTIRYCRTRQFAVTCWRNSVYGPDLWEAAQGKPVKIRDMHAELERDPPTDVRKEHRALAY